MRLRHWMWMSAVGTVILAGCGAAPGGTEESAGPGADAADLGPAGARVRLHGGKTAGSSTSPVLDHGGKVLSVSHTVAIWWGDPAGFPSDAESGLVSLLEGFGGSSYLGIANQYLRGASATNTYAGSYTDTSTAPKKSPTIAQIVGEACSIIDANHLTADTDTLYTVFTSTVLGHASYCAWHAHGTCNGVDIQVAFMPNTAGVAGCDPGNPLDCNTYSQGTRSIADSLAHELMETVTDPDGTAWYDKNGAEIGDKCSFNYQGCVTLSTGSWQLQTEWSNAASGCVQQ